MRNQSSRWGGVSHLGHYRNPTNSAIGKASYPDGSCSIVQNDAGTRGKNCHKTDTAKSRFVHADGGDVNNAVDVPENEDAGAGCIPAGGGFLVEEDSDQLRFENYHAPAAGASDAERIEAAAQWYFLHDAACPRPIVPALKDRFALTSGQAVAAITKARELRRAGGHG